jgi:hypothetical protein
MKPNEEYDLFNRPPPKVPHKRIHGASADWESDICPHCRQSTTYLLAIDRGTVDIVKAISVAIGKKGVNLIHPRKEMEVSGSKLPYLQMVQEGKLTSNQVGNLSRARFHGLIAAIKGQTGNYCLTRKGASFLRGETVPRFAIISKAEKHQIGYLNETCTIFDFTPEVEYWHGINYTIEEGDVFRKAS